MINIEPVRNKIRVSLISAAIIPNSQYSFEGVPFDPSPYDFYIQELVQPDNDTKAATTVDGAQVTFTYNVYTRVGSTGTKKSYEILKKISDVFYDVRPYEISPGIIMVIQEISRRVATDEEGWRLSPIDITVRLETDN